MKKLWFKAKRYGYGWYPASWEGWLVIAVWLALFLVGAKTFVRRIDANLNPPVTAAVYVVYVTVITVVMVVIAAKKGEKARWRWGDDAKDDAGKEQPPSPPNGQPKP